MAITSPSAPSFSASICYSRTESTPFRLLHFSPIQTRLQSGLQFRRFTLSCQLDSSSHFSPIQTRLQSRRFTLSCQLDSSSSSNGSDSSSSSNGSDSSSSSNGSDSSSSSNGSDSSSSSNGSDAEGELDYEIQHGVSTHHFRRGSPVFVMLPLDALSLPEGMMKRKRTMTQSFRALATAGVEGIVMEIWWGLVEREFPGVYNWRGYLEIVVLAKRCGLKVRAVMAFHQCGSGPDDSYWIPLPKWVREEIDKDPDLAYSDRFGRRNKEYISLGCDVLPVLHGRSPIQAYSDFMRSFRDTFTPFLGDVITGIQVGMGPAGELRYPSCPIEKLAWTWRSRELGEFQCYDKYMIASLNACARKIGKREWGNGGPLGTGSLMQDPEGTAFFRNNGSWNTPYGEFFLSWYSGMLLLHGERICREAESIFHGVEVKLTAKLAGMYWHYNTRSHPSELTTGYYNTFIRDGFLPIARMFARYRFTMCCTCFEMRDAEERQMYRGSSPEGFVKQLVLAAWICGIPLQGENAASCLDDESLQQVLRMCKFYFDGPGTPTLSFNFIRMDKNLFEYRNWARFTHFVRQMSDAKIFQANEGFGEGDMPLASLSASTTAGMALAC